MTSSRALNYELFKQLPNELLRKIYCDAVRTKHAKHKYFHDMPAKQKKSIFARTPDDIMSGTIGVSAARVLERIREFIATFKDVTLHSREVTLDTETCVYECTSALQDFRFFVIKENAHSITFKMSNVIEEHFFFVRGHFEFYKMNDKVYQFSFHRRFKKNEHIILEMIRHVGFISTTRSRGMFVRNNELIEKIPKSVYEIFQSVK
jgi:hypothetical protein